MNPPGVARVKVFLLIAAAATFAYWPSLSLPLISDDYIQIWLGRHYGPVSQWASLLQDPLYRCRATSILITHWTESTLGISPLVLNWSSLLLHIVNAFLIYLLGAWQMVGWRLSIAAALAFAVLENYQEAVMWYAALPELLVFTCVIGCVLCWIHWLQGSPRRPALYALALALFVLGLLSKESAVIAPLLLVVVSAFSGERTQRIIAQTLPFFALSLAYFLLNLSGATANQHYSDGTFSLLAPIWITLPNSLARLCWIWGLLALAISTIHRPAGYQRQLSIALCWMVISLLPYSLLTYMHHVPSRHTYMAGAGLALLVAMGYRTAKAAVENHRDRHPKLAHAAAMLAMLFVAINSGYLWLRKHPQYVRRARPTEQLISFARQTNGPIQIKCFPYTREVAIRAVEIGTGQPASQVLWEPDDQSNAGNGYCDTSRP